MNLWDKILQHTERRVNPHSFATWFRPTRLDRSEDDRLTVRVPTRLFCKRLTETYGELLKAVLVEIGKPQLHLDFVCAEAEAPVTAAIANRVNELSGGPGHDRWLSPEIKAVSDLVASRELLDIASRYVTLQ